MSNKLLIIIGAVVVLLLMGIMGAGFYVVLNKISEVSAPDQEIAEEVKEEEETIKPMFPLQSFVVNLADKNGKRYLRSTIELEMSESDLKEEIEQRLPKVRDTILMVLPLKSSDELKSHEGKIALRDEIMEKINSFLTKGTITNVYFTEFVIQ